MTAILLVGDVRERMAELPDASVDLVLTSPPFLALRSYLPAGHPDKAKEIGAEATPAGYLDTLLELTAEWGRLLAPQGSLAVELGDTYAGSGGSGGDYTDAGLRAGQLRYTGSGTRRGAKAGDPPVPPRGPGWPLGKSLCGIPTLYAWSLAYGRNLLTGAESPAGMWRIRTLKPWIRSNPPVGALGDKERPATSYVVVATRARDRYFDLDAVRTPAVHSIEDHQRPSLSRNYDAPGQTERKTRAVGEHGRINSNAAGAPPRDWWHHVDAVLDAVLDEMATSPPTHKRTKGTQPRSGKSADRGGNWASLPEVEQMASDATGARGVHLRRALERAGILRTLEALDVSPTGYSGAHYAVWPPELCRLLIDEMCPRKVCTTCGQPSRRITETPTELRDRHAAFAKTLREHRAVHGMSQADVDALFGFNGMCSHWERRITGPKSQPAYPSPEQWRELRSALAIDTGEFDGIIDGYRRWKDRDLDPEYRAAIERTRSEGFYTSTGNDGKARVGVNGRSITSAHRTVGWSDCGHDTWRPGLILDPFVGSGTTLAVATGMARDAIGIDLDSRNADLAEERVGMFLEVIDAGTQLDLLETVHG